jgi:hypothetical protein
MTGCAAVADDTDVDAVTGCATVAGDFDFALAVAEEEGGGTTIGCKTDFEEVEAGGRTMLVDNFLAVARASLSLLLQEEQVLRGDHSPRLSLPLR